MNKLFTIFFLLFLAKMSAQVDVPMEVIRTKAVDRFTPVTNIFIDAEGNKWVGNRKGLFQVFSPEQSTPVNLKPAEWSLLQTPSGNHDLRLPLDELITQMGNEGKSIQSKDDRITAATFDAKRSELWVGTRKSGLFQFKTQPALKLVQRHHTGNSKMASNQVNALFLDSTGRLWIGTGEGCVYGKDGKWSLEEKYFSIQAFAQNGTDVWVMGNDLLWKVNARGTWEPIDIEENLTEREVVDIAFDGNGLLWIASEIVARFDPATEEYKIFGPAQEFTSQDVSCMAIDSDNGVWIGTNDKGLYIIQKADAMAVTCLIDKTLSCGANAKDAALKVIVDGGTPTYSYQWAGGLNGTNPSNLGPGEYSLTVTDSKGKSKSSKITIPDPNLILTVAQDQPAGESGTNDGKATVSVKGGNPDYTFKWDNGETSASASKLGEGIHTVTVTDKAGCTASESVTISRQVGKLAVNISQVKNLTCPGGKDAVLKVEVNGGKEPFAFDWTDGASGSASQNDFILKVKNTGKPNVSEFEVSAVSAGRYNLNVKDATGQASTAQIEVKDPQAITASVKVDAPASTGNLDGKATVKASGGTGTLSFKWSNGETTASAVKLGPGDHSVTITDGNGCTATASSSITENILPLSVSISQTQEVKCPGEKSAALLAEVSGGKKPFQFQWNDRNLSGEKPAGLGAGDYNLTVTDVTGTTTTAKITVKDAKAFEATAKVDAPASTGNSDGKATAKASGGNGNFTFKWSNGETAATAVKLAPGNHTVTITDGNGCTATTSVSISENILPLSVSISKTQEIKCAGEKTAALQAEVSGGKGPFQFAWTGGAQAETASGLAAGSYDVTVTDMTGTTATAKVAVNEPKPVEATAKVDAPASTGNLDGKATAKATGGNGNFTFKWSNGESAATAVKLAPGNHTVTITDGNGCTATASVSISENILPLSVSISKTQEIKCAGEKTAALQAEVSGGKGPFRFAWTGGAQAETASGLAAGSYDVTVTDVTGTTATARVAVSEPKPVEATAKVDTPASTGNSDGKATAKAIGGNGNFTFKWSNGESAATALKLAPGNHTVTITDGNGCTATASVSISENILPLSVSISKTQEIKCAGEKTAALQAEVSGGKGPFRFAWTGGAQAETASGLAAGSYDVTVTDVTGTTATARVAVSEPKPVEATAKVDTPASTGNSDGKATAKAIGGNGNFTFKWSNGESAATALKLAPGNHTVTITDGNGCTATASVSISENILPLSVSISKTQEIKCAGEKTAALQAEVSGGKGPFRFAWTGGAQAETASGLAAGSYMVTVTDVTGQTQSATVQVTEPQAIKASVTKTRPSTTEKTNNGKATIVASGGAGGFKFQWDNGEAAETANALPVGQHNVTVTDANGCQTVVSFETKVRIIPELTAETLRSGEVIKLEKIYFQPDSTQMEATSIPTVDELFDFLEENPGIVIEVGGHTNNIPSHEFCDQLSSARAKSVAQYLVDKGISTRRITYKGYGKRNPIATNATPEGRAKNQRVEIKIVRLDGD